MLAKEEQLTVGREEGVVFGIVADFERDLDADTEEVGRLRFALTDRLVVTGRRHPLRSLDEVRQALHEGGGPTTPGALIEAVVDRFCDAVARTASRMSDELDRIEDHVVSDLVEREKSRILPVRRTAVRLHRHLASLAVILRDHGEDEPVEEEASPLAIDAARLSSRLAALDQDVLSLQDRARLLQDEVAARLAEETNASLKALSRMTALLLPGSLIAGIWGMNVHGLPFLEADHGFFTVMIMGLIATGIFYWLLRRSGA
jgi:zinc transporter